MLIALLMGIGIAITVLSTVITLENMAANHVNTVGRAAATYSGLITQGNTLISTKGPVTIIGEVTPSAFTLINLTSYEYVSNNTEPVLLLTNVGPVMLDPQTSNALDAADTANNAYYGPYLYHWVEISVNATYAYGAALNYVGASDTNYLSFAGIIINLSNGYYLLSLGPDPINLNPLYGESWSYFLSQTPGIPFLVGPLTTLNSRISGDAGPGIIGCTILYQNICPPPPPSGNNEIFEGNWPSISTSGNELSITIPSNTALYSSLPTAIGIFELTSNAEFTYSEVYYIKNLNTTNWPTWNGNTGYLTLPMNVTTINNTPATVITNPVTITAPQQPNNYYLIMIIWVKYCTVYLGSPPNFQNCKNDILTPAVFFTWQVNNGNPQPAPWLTQQYVNIIKP